MYLGCIFIIIELVFEKMQNLSGALTMIKLKDRSETYLINKLG